VNATVYWFSGTGNSLAVARTIAEELDADLTPIASLPRDEPIHPPTQVIGVVCPVYFFSLPVIVKEFLERLEAGSIEYAFLVLTMGGFAGPAFVHARQRLRASGKPSYAEFGIGMPGNYVAEYNPRDPRKAGRMLGAAERSAHRIADAVQRRRPRRSFANLLFLPFSWPIYALIGRRFQATCRSRDERFLVTDACIHCGTCAAVCPVGDIELVEGRPVWGGACEQCFACVHFCPTAAIQIRGSRSGRRRRYHHPGIEPEDIGVQRRGAQHAVGGR
jgi:NAD-dependent dihydropyrimidine dehydrogenase PreA subunit